jgi:hypothetical protein
MLGHIKPPLCRLSPRAATRYRLLYCSLCLSLRRQFGLPFAALLNHEMNLSLLACADDFDRPQESCACPARGFLGRRPMIAHPRVDLAARLNVLLVWLKLVDGAADGRGFAIRSAAWMMNRRLASFWGDLSDGLRDFIGEYVALIRTPSPDFRDIRQGSALLAGRVFHELAPAAALPLREAASLMGEIVPVADALLDLGEDVRRGQYNPIVEAARRPGISLRDAREELHGDYLGLAERVRGALAQVSDNALFVEALDKSLSGLSHRLARQASFAGAASGNAGSDRRRRGRADGARDRGECWGCDGCCEVLDCCSGCGDVGGCGGCDACGGCGGCDCCGGCG